MSYAHKGEILPLVNQMIPIDKETTFHASYDYHLNGMNQGEVVSPIGEDRATYFNGTDSYIRIQNSQVIPDNTTEFTWQVWLKWNGGGGHSGDARNFIFETSPHYTTNLFINGGRLYSDIVDSGQGARQISTPTQIVIGQWYNVACTFKNGDSYKMYVDGVEISSVAVPATGIYPFTHFNLGTYRGYNGRWLHGDLSAFKVWNKALSKDEIVKSIHGSTNRNGLTGYWKLNEQEGRIAYDSSGNGNDTPWSGGLSPTYGPIQATLKKEDGKFRGAVLIEPDTSNTLLTNPTLSSNTDGWGGFPVGGTTTYHTVSNENGAAKITVVTTGGNGNFHNYALQQTIGTTSTSVFTGSVWVKATKGTTVGIRLSRNTNDGTTTKTHWSGDNTVYGIKTIEASGDWERVSVTIQPYAGVETLIGFHIRVGIESYGTIRVGDVAYIKSVQLEPRDYPTTFINGKRPLGKLWYPKELVNPSAFTISCWFNIPYVHTQSTGNTNIHGSWYHPIIEVAPDIANGVTGLSLASGPAPSPWSRKFTLFVDGTTIEVTGSAIQDNIWYHLTCTFDGTTYTVYLDGVQVKTYTKGPFTVYDNSYLMVGGGYLGKPFSMIDELRIESRAISADEAAAWAASGLHYNYLDYSSYVD